MKTITACSLLLSGLIACAAPADEAEPGQQSAASTSTAENQARLSILQNHREKTLWHCKKGWGNEAVVMFQVDGDVSGMFSGRDIIAVQDPEICHALNVTCPYVGSVHAATFDEIRGAAYAYSSSRGRYEDAIAFISDGAGMKLVAVDTTRQAYLRWDSNWFFNAGECIKD